MRVALVGATGRTGRHVVEALLHAGHKVRVLARDGWVRPGVQVVQGDALDPVKVEALVGGAEAVICVLGPTPGRDPRVCSKAMKVLITEMKEAGVERLVVQTGAMACHENLGSFYRRMRRLNPDAVAERREQERLVRESGLKWTLVRPPLLTDGAGTGSVEVGADLRVGGGASVARVDLARVLVRAATQREWQGQGVTVLQSFTAERPAVALRAWLWRMGLGEFLGIGAAAAVAVVFLGAWGEPKTLPVALAFLACLLAAGALEGALLGFLPGSMLGRVFPKLSVRAFGGYTVAVAVAAWFLGLLPSTLMAGASAPAGGAGGPSTGLVLGLSAVGGLFAGALMGAAQWLALRKVVPHAGQWVLASALGWALGLPLDVLGGMLPSAGDPWLKTIAVAAALGLGAGLVVALPTGLLLLRMLRERGATETVAGQVSGGPRPVVMA